MLLCYFSGYQAMLLWHSEISVSSKQCFYDIVQFHWFVQNQDSWLGKIKKMLNSHQTLPHLLSIYDKNNSFVRLGAQITLGNCLWNLTSLGTNHFAPWSCAQPSMPPGGECLVIDLNFLSRRCVQWTYNYCAKNATFSLFAGQFVV